MAEWTIAPVLKTGIPARVSWVRIPLPPMPICRAPSGVLSMVVPIQVL